MDRMAFTLIQHLYKTENEGKGGRIKKKKRAVRGCVGCFRDLQEQGAVPILKDFTRVCKFLIIRFNKKITIEPTS